MERHGGGTRQRAPGDEVREKKGEREESLVEVSLVSLFLNTTVLIMQAGGRRAGRVESGVREPTGGRASSGKREKNGYRGPERLPPRGTLTLSKT